MIYCNRGFAYMGKGQHDQASIDYNRALDIKSNDGATYNNRAYAYYEKGAYDKAWEDVHKAKSLEWRVNPDSF